CEASAQHGFDLGERLLDTGVRVLCRRRRHFVGEPPIDLRLAVAHLAAADPKGDTEPACRFGIEIDAGAIGLSPLLIGAALCLRAPILLPGDHTNRCPRLPARSPARAGTVCSFLA